MQLGPLSSRSGVIWALRVEERKGWGWGGGVKGKRRNGIGERERNILLWEVKRGRKGPTL